MNKIAVYPGSFDPITVGHVDLIKRISGLFDKVIVLVSHSNDKRYLFSVQERMDFVRKTFQDFKNVEVATYDGLTVDFMKERKAHIIIRGLRAVADFEYEGTLANMNHQLAPDIETFMVFSRPEYYYISSRAVKEVAKNRGSVKGFVPAFLEQILVERINQK